jgi:hypothetical protein
VCTFYLYDYRLHHYFGQENIDCGSKQILRFRYLASHEVPTSLRTTNGLPSSIPWIVVGHLGGSSRPEAHMSIRHNTTWNVMTKLRCHFGSCVLTCFRMFYFTIPQTNLHLSVLHMSFSLAVWNCQVQFCTSLSSELCTNPLPEMHIRVETF